MKLAIVFFVGFVTIPNSLMKLNLITPAFAAILGLALAGAPASVQAQTTPATAPVTTAAPAATPAPAATKPTKPAKAASKEFGGKVTAIDPTTETVTVQSKKKNLTLAISSTTKIKKNKKAATLADFTIGEKVSGHYTTDAAGKMTATSLVNVPAKPAKTATAAAKPAPATAAPAAAPVSNTTPAAQ